jgi:hypothetical protein
VSKKQRAQKKLIEKGEKGQERKGKVIKRQSPRKAARKATGKRD